MIKTAFRPCILISLLLSSAGVTGYGQDILNINRLPEDLSLDGIPDKSIMVSGTRIELIMHAPNFGETPTEKSEVYLGYTNENLWLCANLYYDNPSHIVSTSRKRDEESENTDLFGIVLDSFDDNENGLAFFTTPAGQRIDYTISNDGQRGVGSGSVTNYAWNTFWDVATNKNSTGWSVEIRIPFSSLRFQTVEGKVQMGMIINRTIRHCYETDTYPAINRRYGNNAACKPSRAATVQFHSLRELKPVYISPYIITGLDKANELNAGGTAYVETPLRQSSNLGLDAKVSLTSNMTIDLSVNTDFAQVEADDQTVNLTRYSLFFPEKRMFFQERSSIFNFGLSSSDNLFYSRRIGMDESGIPVPILGGIRFTGRARKWDLGFMDMQTRTKNDIQGENFSVFRARRQVFNSNSYIGAMLTSRVGSPLNAFSYGIDGIFKVFGEDYLLVSLAQTTDSVGNNLTFSGTPSYLRVNWQKRNSRGFSYNTSYHCIGKAFNPEMGFLTLSGIKGGDIELRYSWIPSAESKLFNYSIFLDFSQNNRMTNNSIESRTFGPGFSIQTKSGWFWRLKLEEVTQGVTERFSIGSGVEIPEGNYNYFTSDLMFNTPMYRPIALVINTSAGRFYDGKNFSVNFQPVCNLSESLQITGYYSYTYLTIPAREQELNAHLIRVKALYMYNTKLSISSFIQFSTIHQTAVCNFRLRYNHKEGNDLYLVYNESKPTMYFFDDSIEPVNFLNRQLQIKYIHTFKI